MRTDYVTYDNSTFPEMIGKECTSEDSKDGTPVDSNLLNEWWGFMQAAAYQGGITPSGSNDIYSESDILNGLRNILGSPGDVVYSCANYETLQSKGMRLLLATGQVVLIEDYPLISEYCYVGDSENSTANAFYKCNSLGTRSISGEYIKIPDLQYYFIRGWNPGTSEFLQQDDAIKNHQHEIMTPQLGETGPGRLSGTPEYASTDYSIMRITDAALPGVPYVYARKMKEYNSVTDSYDIENDEEYETRPSCVRVRCYIRY